MSENDNHEIDQRDARGRISVEVNEQGRRIVLHPQQPRQPRNLQDLLRYATEAGANGEPPANQPRPQPMYGEARQFLEEYLASMTVNVTAELEASLGIIEKCIATEYFDEEECNEAFEKILNLVDRIDNANDFHKIGGFRIFPACLTSDSIQLKEQCCELIAELCQNNPYCQSKCVEEGYLPTIISLIDNDTSDAVRIKALYAISCLVRENKAALAEFRAKDGFSALLLALQSDSFKLKLKSSFLISSLCSTNADIKGELVAVGFVEQIVGVIIQNKSEYEFVEHPLSALCSLISDCPEAQEICRKPELQLQSILECIIDETKEKDEFWMVLDYAKVIEQIVFISEDSNSIDEDR